MKMTRIIIDFSSHMLSPNRKRICLYTDVINCNKQTASFANCRATIFFSSGTYFKLSRQVLELEGLVSLGHLKHFEILEWLYFNLL